MIRIITLCTSALALAMFASANANAGVHGCHYPRDGGFGPVNDRYMNIGNVSVRNMTCREARHAINVSTLLRNGNIRTRRFSCHLLKSYRPRGYRTVIGAEIRCTHRSP